MLDREHDPVVDVLLLFKDRDGKELEVVIEDSPLKVVIREEHGNVPMPSLSVNQTLFVAQIASEVTSFVNHARTKRAEEDALLLKEDTNDTDKATKH